MIPAEGPGRTLSDPDAERRARCWVARLAQFIQGAGAFNPCAKARKRDELCFPQTLSSPALGAFSSHVQHPSSANAWISSLTSSFMPSRPNIESQESKSTLPQHKLPSPFPCLFTILISFPISRRMLGRSDQAGRDLFAQRPQLTFSQVSSSSVRYFLLYMSTRSTQSFSRVFSYLFSRKHFSPLCLVKMVIKCIHPSG